MFAWRVICQTLTIVSQSGSQATHMLMPKGEGSSGSCLRKTVKTLGYDSLKPATCAVYLYFNVIFYVAHGLPTTNILRVEFRKAQGLWTFERMVIKTVSLSRRDLVDCIELYCSKQQCFRPLLWFSVRVWWQISVIVCGVLLGGTIKIK